MAITPKNPLLAVFLSIIYPGIGQIYSGRRQQGLLFIVIITLTGGSLGAYIVHPITKINLGIIAAYVLFIVFCYHVIINSYFCAKKYNEGHNVEASTNTIYNNIFGLVMLVLFAPLMLRLGLGLFVRANIIKAYRISSGAMSSTFIEGDRLMTDVRIYKKTQPQRGDIIVFSYPKDPKRDFIKRIIAFSGEKVEIKAGDIYINDELVLDKKIKDIFYYNKGVYGKEGEPVYVPKNNYYCLGDNSRASHDSRYWGFVPKENVVGKVFKIYWPPERSGYVE